MRAAQSLERGRWRQIHGSACRPPGPSQRGGKAQQTDVVQLNASLLEVVSETGRHIASVRFNGLLREEKDAAPAPFDEVWHLVKPTDGSRGWMVAGIQQLS